ncbi:MAG TPA: helix-turn-helix domain-containing protein [Streptosporangiaceae bacterium]|nr:helix-turn-helix domain-containing protein [Streptosporangiaceae bacterium]
MRGSGDCAPLVVRLLADPVRWALVRQLAYSDQLVRELAQVLGQPQNLVSYHLRRLRDGGLVASRRSSLDGRDTYYSLNLDACSRALSDAAAAVHPGLVHWPGQGQGEDPWQVPAVPRVLFVCTGNSGRSPMAEAMLAQRAGSRILAGSAGIRPKPVHPMAVAVMMDRYGVDIAGRRPVSVEAVAGWRFDFVISLCDRAREACPRFAGRPGRMHWSLPDPASGEGGQASYLAFERTVNDLDTRIEFLLRALTISE